MVAEQVSRSRYWAASGLEIEIRMAARVEVPGEPGVDVDTELQFSESFVPPWDDLVAARLYEGVHAGLAAVGTPLPRTGIRILITEFVVSPPLTASADPVERRAIEEMIRALAASTVEALWTGLSQPAGSVVDDRSPD